MKGDVPQIETLRAASGLLHHLFRESDALDKIRPHLYKRSGVGAVTTTDASNTQPFGGDNPVPVTSMFH